METRRVSEGYNDACFSLAYASGFQKCATSKLALRACISAAREQDGSMRPQNVSRYVTTSVPGRIGAGSIRQAQRIQCGPTDCILQRDSLRVDKEIVLVDVGGGDRFAAQCRVPT